MIPKSTIFLNNKKDIMKTADFIFTAFLIPIIYILSSLFTVCACSLGAERGLALLITDSALLASLILGFIFKIHKLKPVYIIMAAIVSPVLISAISYTIHGRF